MSSLENLSKVLSSARSGEWLYTQKKSYSYYYEAEEFCVTNGYWDKFCLCVSDVFYGFSSAQNTQEKVEGAFKNAVENFKKEEFDGGPLKHVENVQYYRNSLTNLNKVTLVWGKTLNTAPEFNPWEAIDLNNDIDAMEEIFRILPKEERTKYHNLKEIIAAGIKSRSSTAPSSNPLGLWLNVAGALKQCKQAWLVRFDAKHDWDNWSYRLGEWKIRPENKTFKTASNCTKTLHYLSISLDTNRVFFDGIRGKDSLKDDDFEKLKKQLLQTHINTIFHFTHSQSSNQKRPISICIETLKENTTSIEFVRFSKFIDALVKEILEKMEKNPDDFIHQTSLFVEASPYEKENNDIRSSLCLSRVVGYSIKEPLFPKAYLRKEFNELILELSQNKLINQMLLKIKADCYIKSFTDELKLLQKQKIELKFMGMKETYNFVIEFSGIAKGCHKTILREAFPFLKAREKNKHNFKDTDLNLLSLNTLGLKLNVDPGFKKWILNALLIFAYTRQHPNLTTEITPGTQEAFTAYCTLLEYLRPDAFLTEI
jgi:hypothetical protein